MSEPRTASIMSTEKTRGALAAEIASWRAELGALESRPLRDRTGASSGDGVFAVHGERWERKR